MPPIIVVALGALGAAAVVKVIAAEARRINAALDRHRAAAPEEPAPVRLERDPVTGAYRPRPD